MRRLLVFLCLAIGGCAYFNGIYNAREAAGKGDRLIRAGKHEDAAAAYALAAASAETVLARYPRSRWRADALFLAGRAAALAGRCEQAIGRLREFLATAEVTDRRRPAAALVRGRCLTEMGRHADARAALEPLERHADAGLRNEAALWASRAAFAMGDAAAAERHLAGIDPVIAQWELARAAMAARDFVRAESLLALRADAGDLAPAAENAIVELWGAGRTDGALDLVRRYGGSRADGRAVARLHLVAADLLIAARRDSLAAQHARLARTRLVDSLVRQEAEARLALVALRELESLSDVQAAMVRARQAGAGGAIWRRLERNLLLVEFLAGRPDDAGASKFLAAEVARDSLRAPGIAHALLRQVVDAAPDGPLAPKALLAAALVMPDSAAAYRTRVAARYPSSPYAALVQGDGAGVSTRGPEQELLRQAWQSAIAAFPDSAARTPPPGVARAESLARPAPPLR